MEPNNKLQDLKKKQELLKRKNEEIQKPWLKISFSKKQNQDHLFDIKKKYVPRAIDRNRLKRWFREKLKKIPLKHKLYIKVLPQGKTFYKTLKRREFDKTLNEAIKEHERGQ